MRRVDVPLLVICTLLGAAYGHLGRASGASEDALAFIVARLHDPYPHVYGILLPVLLAAERRTELESAMSSRLRFGSRLRMLRAAMAQRAWLASQATLGLLLGFSTAAVGLSLRPGSTVAEPYLPGALGALPSATVMAAQAVTLAVGLAILATAPFLGSWLGIPRKVTLVVVWLASAASVAGVLPLPIMALTSLDEQWRLLGAPLILLLLAVWAARWALVPRGWRVRAAGLGLFLLVVLGSPLIQGAAGGADSRSLLGALDVLQGPGDVRLVPYLALALITAAPLVTLLAEADSGWAESSRLRMLRRGAQTMEMMATLRDLLRASVVLQLSALALLLGAGALAQVPMSWDEPTLRRCVWWVIAPGLNLLALGPVMLTWAMRSGASRPLLVWVGLWLFGPLLFSTLLRGAVLGALNSVNAQRLGAAALIAAAVAGASVAVLYVFERKRYRL